MSAMLALRCAAPVFAVVGAATVWAMAGPMAAGLTLVVFLLGVITSELHRLRWKDVEPAALTPADHALLEMLDGRAAPVEAEPPAELEPAAAEAPEPAPPPVWIPPKRSFRCHCPALAIGSGRTRTGLTERSRRHAARPAPLPRRKPEPAPAQPPRPAEAQTLRFRAAYEARLTA